MVVTECIRLENYATNTSRGNISSQKTGGEKRQLVLCSACLLASPCAGSESSLAWGGRMCLLDRQVPLLVADLHRTHFGALFANRRPANRGT